MTKNFLWIYQSYINQNTGNKMQCEEKEVTSNWMEQLIV